MKFFKFIKKAEYEKREGTYYAIIHDEINSKEILLKELYAGLRSPSYFAHNWDSLHDCLRP